MDEETEALNKKGRDDLSELYKNNQNARDKIISFVGDKVELSNDQIIDKRYKYNTRIKLGVETLSKFAPNFICSNFICSKDHARSLIEFIQKLN